jgi:tetratricopeptide (TPR) repeat protein
MAQPSFAEKVGDGVKSGTSKMVALVSPKPAPGSGAPSPPSAKPGPGVFVALAEMQERSGNVEEAETQLRKALAMDANHLGALVAYGHLEDRRGNFEAATKYYQRALKKHPKEASAHNDLGLCYHRRGMLPEAVKSLQTAIELQPHRKLYRDNLAAVLVDQGKPTDALVQLSAAHGEAVGNYNLGYLLAQKKNKSAALYHFRKAAEKDPSLTAANEWVAQLSGGAGAGGPPSTPGPPAIQRPPVIVAQRPVNPPVTAAPLAPDANRSSALVRASGVDTNSQYPAPSTPPKREARSMQYPPISPAVGPSAAASAPEQTSSDRRLPAVEPARG